MTAALTPTGEVRGQEGPAREVDEAAEGLVGGSLDTQWIHDVEALGVHIAYGYSFLANTKSHFFSLESGYLPKT